MGSSKGKPAMQVVAVYIVTNITEYNLRLTTAELQISKTIGRVITKDSNSVYYGEYPLPPGYSSEMHLEFWVIPPFKNAGDEFTSNIIINDQFGNKYKIKEVHFVYS